MHRFRIGTKRGLTEIPTATILMFAVALMGVFLLTWSNQVMMAKSNDLTEAFDDKINRLAEEVMIDNIWFGTGSSSKFVNVTLSNISSIGITITEIEFVNSTTTQIITLNQNVFPGGTLSTEQAYIWTSGTVTDITISTARGNAIKTQVTP